MTFHQNGEGFKAGDWVTLDGPNVTIYLSDGGRLQLLIEADHGEPNPSPVWRAEHFDSDGVLHPVPFMSFETRPEAMTFARQWIKDRGCVMVPSTDQRAAPWFGKYDQSSRPDNGLKVITPGTVRKPEPQKPDALAEALALAQAIDMAMHIDAAMKAASNA